MILETVLSIDNISKAYGSIKALQQVSFSVPTGSVFGILGPNGSGKTTLLGILLDVLKANEGTYQWFGGIPTNEARRQIGSLLETPNFYHYLSAMDNLGIASAIKQRGRDEREEVLRIVNLYERRHSNFQTFSLGMKQRLAIAAALLGKPRLLVLDEPTNGLDPAGIAEIRNLILQLNRQGMTVIMASHLLDEVEKVCSHVAILKKGVLLVDGSVDAVLRSDDLIEVRAQDMQRLQDVLVQMPGIEKIALGNQCLNLTANADIRPEDVNRYCAGHGLYLSHLATRKKSLEMKFMELTNE